VKLLFDQNLSPRLVRLLADLFPGSVHVMELGADRAPDDAVWGLARDGGFAIVSKDGDFQVRSVLLGHPPKVIWLRVGNAGTPEIAGLLRGARAELLMFDGDGAAALLTVGLLGSEGGVATTVGSS